MSTVNQTSSAVIEPPKLSRRRWGIILILLLAAVVNYLDRANLSIANTTISKEFGFSGTEMGLLLSAFLWPYALANLPAGWLVDRTDGHAELIAADAGQRRNIVRHFTASNQRPDFSQNGIEHCVIYYRRHARLLANNKIRAVIIGARGAKKQPLSRFGAAK